MVCLQCASECTKSKRRKKGFIFSHLLDSLTANPRAEFHRKFNPEVKKCEESPRHERAQGQFSCCSPHRSSPMMAKTTRCDRGSTAHRLIKMGEVEVGGGGCLQSVTFTHTRLSPEIRLFISVFSTKQQPRPNTLIAPEF